MEEPHIPVIPNINSQTNSNSHANINSQANKKSRRNIFDSERDPEQQTIPRKKIDILDIETQKTNEELSSKKEDSSLSWIIVALVVVVIILLIAITYYILTKNSAKLASPIPPDIVKPNPIQYQMAQMAQQMRAHPDMRPGDMRPGDMRQDSGYQGYMHANGARTDDTHLNMQPNMHSNGVHADDVQFVRPAETNTARGVLSNIQNQAHSTHRPKMYVEPTRDELDEVLEQAQNRKSEISPDDIDEVSNEFDREADNEATIDNTISKNIENLIFDEDFSDDNGNINYINPNEIDEFHNQVINDE